MIEHILGKNEVLGSSAMERKSGGKRGREEGRVGYPGKKVLRMGGDYNRNCRRTALGRTTKKNVN